MQTKSGQIYFMWDRFYIAIKGIEELYIENKSMDEFYLAFKQMDLFKRDKKGNRLILRGKDVDGYI